MHFKIIIFFHNDFFFSLFLSPLPDFAFMTQEQDESDAQAEGARKKMKSRVMTEAGLKASRQPPKNPRKNSKKATNAESVSESTAISTSSSMETGKT